jgi:hypothetical protein
VLRDEKTRSSTEFPPPITKPSTVTSSHRVADLDSSPISVAMERRALQQIFYRLDLPFVPGWAFTALEETRDPVVAFKRFAIWVGVDPIAARDRAATARQRMALAIELLSQLAPLRTLLTPDGDRRIRDALADTAGHDPLSILSDHMECVTAAAELHRIGSRLEELPSCILASRLRNLINDTTGDPLATPTDEIEEGIEIGRRLEDTLRLLAGFREDVTRDLQCLDKAFLHGTLSKKHAPWCNGQADAFEVMLDIVEHDDTLDIDKLEEYVKQGEVIRDSLARMRAAAGSAGPGGAHRPDPIKKVEEALATLGLTLSPKLTWRAIKRAYDNLRKAHHTDFPINRKTKEQEDANNKRMQEINGAVDDLRSAHKDKLVEIKA